MKKYNINPVLQRYYPYLILTLPYILFYMATRLSYRMIVDEHLIHLKTIEVFASSFPSFNLKEYPSPIGPFPYILWTIFGKIFGFEIWKLRSLTMIFSYLGSLIFFVTCREQKIAHPLLKTLILIFSPYIFLHSFTIYTLVPALFWQLFSLRFFLRYTSSRSRGDLLWGALGALALVFSRQVDVALPLGVFCFFLLERDLRKPFTLLGPFLPILGFLLLFLYWGGITPPSSQMGHSPSLNLVHITFFLTIIGFYFYPAGFSEMIKLKARSFLLLFLIPFFLILPVSYPKEGIGIIYYAMDWFSRTWYSGFWEILPLYLAIVGSLVFYSMTKGNLRTGKSMPLYVLLSYLLLNSVNPFVVERHYYFAWPMILLLLPKHISENRLLLILILVLHVGISLSYVKLMLVFPG